jgi:predicted glutamine amidotransferase
MYSYLVLDLKSSNESMKKHRNKHGYGIEVFLKSKMLLFHTPSKLNVSNNLK